MHTQTKRLVVAVLGASSFALAACGAPSQPASRSQTGQHVSVSATAVVSSRSIPGVGSVLVDGKGFTMYTYDPDTTSTIACTGQCAVNWPPLMGQPTSTDAAIPSTKLSTEKRPDGTAQATYGGHALYLFSGDKAPGQDNGDGLMGVWHVVKVPAGSAAPSTAPSTMAPSTNSGGGYNY
ncbi:secreted repeat protein with Y-X4-D motif [Antricoccus suffuscus]|uniref:Secreted repeat protein with Y-X4-D motif n=1 Tax=Antricoccus suffuscus TaxID=1629062 RepID=A0A2T1A5X0_9ACTN|nr:hypothetical protein [Antricoccus suffuscus]PRZ43986.1 secreted repeat protein with Y-X4-D motif [Antricoccus suffuscus]